jgi:hypothetical protein
MSGSSKWFSSPRFSAKTLFPLLLSIRATWPTHIFFLYSFTRMIFSEEYRA